MPSLVFKQSVCNIARFSLHLMQKDKPKFQSKVSIDTGLVRGRVPAPLLKVIGARAGDFLTFRLVSTGEAVMRVARATKKTSKKKDKQS